MGLLLPAGQPLLAQQAPGVPPVTSLVLNVSNRCNLSCTYCYEYGADRLSDAQKKTPARMDAQTARSSIEFLIRESRGARELNLTFFGGETLLGIETIRAAVAHAEQRARELGLRFAYSLTTNATLLDEPTIEFLARHRFGVNVSIDGSRTDHDRHRRFSSGRGSYEEIVPRVRALLAALRGGRPVGARVTLTRGMDSIEETFRHLSQELGFEHVGFAPVTSSDDREWALDGPAMGAVLRGFRALAREYVACALDNREHGFSNLHDLLGELHRGANKSHPCGAALGLVGVSTSGELSPCHRFVESASHVMGDLEHGLDAAKRSEFLERGHVQRKLACHECFARPHCAGGCYHEAYVRYADAALPNLHYCEWIRAWTALGLETYAAIALANPAYLERFEDGGASAAPRMPSVLGKENA